MKLSLNKAQLNDCDEIYNMQIHAFSSLLEKYKDYKTNPGAESVQKIIDRMNQKFTDYYIIKLEDKNIGAIRIVRLHHNRCRISPIFILPEFQGKGYAQKAIKEVEKIYPHAKGWELDTIKQEAKLCHLYEKLGYKSTGKEESLQDNMTIVFYSK
jgi:RimJ/RimL family protein N-acetyltransferase